MKLLHVLILSAAIIIGFINPLTVWGCLVLTNWQWYGALALYLHH